MFRLELELDEGWERLRFTVNPSFFSQVMSLITDSPRDGGAVKLASSSGERPQSPRLADAKAEGATFSGSLSCPTWLKATVSSAVCKVAENSGFWMVASLARACRLLGSIGPVRSMAC